MISGSSPAISSEDSKREGAATRDGFPVDLASSFKRVMSDGFATTSSIRTGSRTPSMRCISPNCKSASIASVTSPAFAHSEASNVAMVLFPHPPLAPTTATTVPTPSLETQRLSLRDCVGSSKTKDACDSHSPSSAQASAPLAGFISGSFPQPSPQSNDGPSSSRLIFWPRSPQRLFANTKRSTKHAWESTPSTFATDALLASDPLFTAHAKYTFLNGSSYFSAAATLSGSMSSQETTHASSIPSRRAARRHSSAVAQHSIQETACRLDSSKPSS